MTTTALITGATSGIGHAAADELAQSGVHVMVLGRNMDRGGETITQIRAAGGKADFISSDLRDAASDPCSREKGRRAGRRPCRHPDQQRGHLSVRRNARDERGVVRRGLCAECQGALFPRRVRRDSDVSSWHLADIEQVQKNVCFRGRSGPPTYDPRCRKVIQREAA